MARYNINVSPWMQGSQAMAQGIRDQGAADAAKIKSRQGAMDKIAGLAASIFLPGAAGAMLGPAMASGDPMAAMGGLASYSHAQKDNPLSAFFSGKENPMGTTGISAGEMKRFNREMSSPFMRMFG